MYLFDTNVVSALRRPDRLEPRIAQTLGEIPGHVIFVSVMTLMELEIGIVSMERKDARQGLRLRRWFERLRIEAEPGSILPVTEAISLRCARLHVPDRRSQVDALLAATALIHGLSIVTRNVRDFAGIEGLTILDPWA